MSERRSSPGSRDSLMPNAEQRARLRKIRRFKDGLSRYGVGTAGMMVVGALALIFLYLFSEVAPLLRSSSLDVTTEYHSPVTSPANPSEHLVLERYEEMGASFNRSGLVSFFNADTGLLIDSVKVPSPEGAEFSSLATSVPSEQLVAYGFSDGSVSLVQEDYKLSYPDDTRLVTPGLTFPLGEEPIVLDEEGQALRKLAVQETKAGIMMAGVAEDGRLLLGRFNSRENLFGGATEVSAV